jgi:hypothetical protein
MLKRPFFAWNHWPTSFAEFDMKLGLVAVLLAALLGVAGYLVYQAGLVPVPLAEGRQLYAPATPEFGEEAARLEVLLPTGPALEALLAHQAELAVLDRNTEGAWAGVLITGLQASRHQRHWQLKLRQGWRMQEGGTLDVARLAAALGPEVARLGGEAKALDGEMLDLRFPSRQADLPERLAQWRVPGTGPFRRQGQVLSRFDGFTWGKAGVAGLTVMTDPALLESQAWAEGLATGRWAWAVFPGSIAPEDMAKVRLAPYDELRLKDGSVWFLSRKLRRLRPDQTDWTRTRLFGVWRGAVDLPYDPLGM